MYLKGDPVKMLKNSLLFFSLRGGGFDFTGPIKCTGSDIWDLW